MATTQVTTTPLMLRHLSVKLCRHCKVHTSSNPLYIHSGEERLLAEIVVVYRRWISQASVIKIVVHEVAL